MPLILGTNSIKETGYDVDNSLRFNDDDGANLNKSYGGSTDTNFTFSAWVKRSDLGNTEALFSHWNGSSDGNRFIIYFEGDSLVAYHNNSSGSGADMYVKTTAVYRDPSAWYHYVVAIDTTQGVAANRVKIYVNGVQQTSLSQTTYPAQDYAVYAFHSSGTTYLGRNASGDSAPTKFFDGYMAEVFLIDGTTYAASNFGEYDSDSPTIWKPKDCKDDLTFGTNGTYLDFEDSDNLGDDESGNGNDLTETNIVAADQATDTCTNNFCTMNPLDFTPTTFAQGNLKLNFAQSPNVFGITTGTLFMGSGKYYFEAKITSPDSSTGIQVGVIQVEPYLSRLTAPGVDLSLFFGLGARFITTGGVHKVLNGTDSSISDSWSNDDIIRIAYDGSAGKIYMFNGTSELTGQDFSAGTSFNNGTLTPGTMVLPYTSFGDGGSGTKTAQVEWNFGGCPAFSISSGNTDANGYGNFEYSVPSGYYALNSKNLAEFG